MKTGIVMSSEIDAAEGHPLSADYWLNRQDGETYSQFRRRRTAEVLEARAARHETIARRQRQQAWELRHKGTRRPR